MPELSYLVWELRAVRVRRLLHSKVDARSPVCIARATAVQLAATSFCLLLCFVGNVVGLLGVTSDWPAVRTAYILLLALEALLLLADCAVAAAVASSCFGRRMGLERPTSSERRLHIFSVFAILAFSFLVDLPSGVVKFTFLHYTRFSSPDIKGLLLASGVMCTVGQAFKTCLLLLHFVWKQMTPQMDPLHEKAPVYFPTSPLADSLLWGVSMMMPVVNLMLSAAVMCMAFMTVSV